MTNRHKRQITIDVSQELFDTISDYSKINGITKADIARFGIMEYLYSHSGKKVSDEVRDYEEQEQAKRMVNIQIKELHKWIERNRKSN